LEVAVVCSMWNDVHGRYVWSVVIQIAGRYCRLDGGPLGTTVCTFITAHTPDNYNFRFFCNHPYFISLFNS